MMEVKCRSDLPPSRRVGQLTRPTNDGWLPAIIEVDGPCDRCGSARRFFIRTAHPSGRTARVSDCEDCGSFSAVTLLPPGALL